jgi:hypothetical protein
VRYIDASEGKIDLKLPGKLRMHGNIMIAFKYSGSLAFGPNDLFRVTFNTAFIGTDNMLDLDRLSLSPEGIHKDTKMIGEEFRCQIYFSDFCKSETPCRSDRTPLEKICLRCKGVMADEIDNWYSATKILHAHRPMTPEQAR